MADKFKLSEEEYERIMESVVFEVLGRGHRFMKYNRALNDHMEPIYSVSLAESVFKKMLKDAAHLGMKRGLEFIDRSMKP